VGPILGKESRNVCSRNSGSHIELAHYVGAAYLAEFPQRGSDELLPPIFEPAAHAATSGA
jgi:hypothetical protein